MKQRFFSTIKKNPTVYKILTDILWLMMLVCVSAGMGIYSFRSVTGQESETKLVNESISREELRTWIESESAGVLIDARSPLFYQMGHIGKAINVPRLEIDGAGSLPKVLASVKKDTPLIVYCSDQNCEDSTIVAGFLRQRGFLKIRVYKGGWEDWQMGEPKL